MNKDSETVATQKLLEVIRGAPFSGNHFLSGPSEAVQEGSSTLSGTQQVLLSPPEPPRCRFRARVRVGLDIGHSMVKMVKVELTSRNVRLLQVGLAPVRSSSPENSERAQAASALLNAVKGSPVVTSLGDANTLVRQISFPKMPPRQLVQAMEFEARKHLPYDPAKMLLRHQVVAQDRKNSTCQVLLVAVARDALREHQALLKRLGLEPHAIEAAPLALANVSLLAAGDSEETVVVVDIGFSGTLISIQRKDGMFFSRYIPLSLGTKGQGAPDLKGSKLEDLVVETRRSLAYYDNVTGKMGFSKVMLAGGGAMLQEVGSILQEKLGLPVEPLNPLARIHRDKGPHSQDWVAQTSPLWAQALGLTLGH